MSLLNLGGYQVLTKFAAGHRCSVQFAHIPRPPAGYVRSMAAAGQTYHVYVHSYLNYGLMMGRGAVLTLPQSAKCLPKGVTGSYKNPYGGAVFPLQVRSFVPGWGLVLQKDRRMLL